MKRSPRLKPGWRLGSLLLVVLVATLGSRTLAQKKRIPAGLSGLLAFVGATHLMEERRGKPNRLIHEKSPYLLQHAYNPVGWYPWGEEAFEKARREDKPIFLSIGYSTCHWCHVMERESFEDDSVAALLNQDFVPIKVDREERPDVDRVYMAAAQAMGVGGGWPLNVFLTPELQPFFGGTYFPPRSMMGRPGMLEVLPRVHQAWVGHRGEIRATGAQVLEALAAVSAPDSVPIERERLFDRAYQTLERSFDAEQGGFGSQPKFPSVVNLDFLLRYWARDPKARPRAREMVVRQLDRMRAGGIHDHLGGGFHRYATDRIWLVPHFEKMLYDQAELAWSYLEGYQVTGDTRYADTARGIFAYVSRDLGTPEGAFLSAEDADSEGEEGKFYVWTPAEVEKVLGPEDAKLFNRRYGVNEAGNFEHGASILHEATPIAELAIAFQLLPDQVEAKLAKARTQLLEARSRRVRPHRDDKVLTAWNGLMISAFARGARILGDPELAKRGVGAAEFVWQRLRDPRSGDLKRRWRAGEAKGLGQLDDYAYYALGLVDLYGATLDPRWLERAVTVTEAAVARFWDEQDGGFFESPAGDPSIKVRMKDGFDGAEIAGNSIASYVLQLLATLLDRRDWQEKANRTFDHFARRLGANPAAMPQMLVAMDLAEGDPRHVVIAGRADAADTRALIAEFNRRFLPHDQLLLADGGAGQERLARLAPFTAPLKTTKGRATAYVCEHYACKLPTTERAAFAAALDREAVAERGRP
ncbi:MAG TPA: thioredoxin domain-containing protein [Candidatus Eisenbacteria bacterium]